MEDDREPDTEGTQARSSGGRTGLLIAAIAVLTVIAILLVPGEREPADGTPEPAPHTAPEATRPSLLAPRDDAPATEVAPDDGPKDGATAPSAAPGAAARRLIRELRAQTPPDVERAWKAARAFEAEGRTEDAWLLYFYAAREGHGPSALTLARQADPRSFREDGLYARPDALQALKWYRRAAEAGAAEARTALEGLRESIERAAASGDEQARRLMLQWK